MCEEYRGSELETAHRRIADLETAVRRGIAQIERLLPCVMWDGMDDELDETSTHATLDLMRAAAEAAHQAAQL